MPAYKAPNQGLEIAQGYAEANAYAHITRPPLDTIEVNHSLATVPIRYVADHADFVATTEDGESATFLKAGFDCQLPAVAPGEASRLRITIHGVSSDAAEMIRAAAATTEPVTVIHRVYTGDDPTGPAIKQIGVFHLVAVNSITSTSVQLDCTLGDAANRAFPAKRYTRADYPTLAR